MAGQVDPRLERALELTDPTSRQLEIAAVVAEALSDLGVVPVVVGGLAVAYWSSGAYLTGDIDVLMPTTDAIQDRLATLGFERRGRFWLIPAADVFLEAPANALDPDEAAQDVETAEGRRVRIERPEDILVRRLHEFVATGHRDAAAQALLLLAAPELDQARLHLRATTERLRHALTAIEQLADRIKRGETIESWELHDLARRLQ